MVVNTAEGRVKASNVQHDGSLAPDLRPLGANAPGTRRVVSRPVVRLRRELPRTHPKHLESGKPSWAGQVGSGPQRVESRGGLPYAGAPFSARRL